MVRIRLSRDVLDPLKSVKLLNVVLERGHHVALRLGVTRVQELKQASREHALVEDPTLSDPNLGQAIQHL